MDVWIKTANERRESISTYIAEVRRMRSQVHIRFNSESSGKSAGFLLPTNEAKRLAQAILFSVEGQLEEIVTPVKFPNVVPARAKAS